MEGNAEASFICKRCRAGAAKRCRCPLPTVASDHDWDADAAYNLWPGRAGIPVAGPASWGWPIAGPRVAAQRSHT